jgi:hypothetical protein
MATLPVRSKGLLLKMSAPYCVMSDAFCGASGVDHRKTDGKMEEGRQRRVSASPIRPTPSDAR